MKDKAKKVYDFIIISKRRVISLLKFYAAKYLSKSGFLSALYYGVFSSSFRRECRSVLYGKYKYITNSSSNKADIFFLRRSIHRIEKGLIMKERKEIFALDYIENAVINFINLYQSHFSADSQNLDVLKWAFDVLTEYFNNVGNHPKINAARQLFKLQNYDVLASQSQKQFKPYQRLNSPKSLVNIDEFITLCMRRRSVRWYQDRPVPRNLVEKALMAANLSPTACNRQPYQFRIFDDKESVKAIGGIPMGTVGFYDNFPMIVVIVGNLSAYDSERDRHLIYIDGSLAAMSFMLALETLGLSSCPINWPDIEKLEKRMDNQLGLAVDERPIMLISVGYADEEAMIPYSQKKVLSELANYN